MIVPTWTDEYKEIENTFAEYRFYSDEETAKLSRKERRKNGIQPKRKIVSDSRRLRERKKLLARKIK